MARHAWTFSATLAAVGLSGVALSLLFVRAADYLGYLQVLAIVSKHGEAYYPNQTVNGLLHRWFSNGDSTQWYYHSYPPFHPHVYWGTLVTSLLLVALALVARRRPKGIGRDADFALAGLVATMASPIAWEHHYGVLAPIFAFLLPALLKYPVAGRATLPLLAASYVLASNFIDAAQRLTEVPVWNVLQSYLFFAALTVLALLWRLRCADPPTPAAISAPA